MNTCVARCSQQAHAQPPGAVAVVEAWRDEMTFPKVWWAVE